MKLVHRRSKTKTSAARVRSLWNEMKTVRSFGPDAHPAIVRFHAFVITPSYALIEMDFLPRLVPVEVREDKAKDWFRALADAVAFLHARGVVHNDIKPANILLTPADAPVLVDFGFAQRYDVRGEGAFVSRLSYGTPEYLAPERARGLAHDTRKSDVWALGVTLFEILEGRTPFESAEGTRRPPWLLRADGAQGRASRPRRTSSGTTPAPSRAAGSAPTPASPRVRPSSRRGRVLTRRRHRAAAAQDDRAQRRPARHHRRRRRRRLLCARPRLCVPRRACLHSNPVHRVALLPPPMMIPKTFARQSERPAARCRPPLSIYYSDPSLRRC